MPLSHPNWFRQCASFFSMKSLLPGHVRSLAVSRLPAAWRHADFVRRGRWSFEGRLTCQRNSVRYSDIPVCSTRAPGKNTRAGLSEYQTNIPVHYRSRGSERTKCDLKPALERKGEVVCSLLALASELGSATHWFRPASGHFPRNFIHSA